MFIKYILVRFIKWKGKKRHDNWQDQTKKMSLVNGTLVKGKWLFVILGKLAGEAWRESGWWNKQNIKILVVGDKSKESEFKGGQFGNDVESTFFNA